MRKLITARARKNKRTDRKDHSIPLKMSDCPLERKCLQPNVIYQATVTTEKTTATYLGLAKNFKEGTKHPFDTGNENMRQNFSNMF